MSSSVANDTPPSPSPSLPSGSPQSRAGSGHGTGPTAVAAAPCPQDEEGEAARCLLLDAAKNPREIVRLVQCHICSGIIREPVTLPCGSSLCHSCIPQTHLRTNISWPATSSRLEGFVCPFDHCQKEHAIGDCSLDVTLSKALAVIGAGVDDSQNSPDRPAWSTHISTRDEWQLAGVPALAERDNGSMVLPGGRLLATYAFAQMGKLKHDCEIAYTMIDGDDDAAVQHRDQTFFMRLKEAVRAEMDCQVCYAIFLDPLTTTCGHTFCRTCVRRVLDHSNLCPICRRILSIQAQVTPEACPSNQRLTKMLSGFWADLLLQRTQAYRLEQQANHGGYDIPIFVCTLSFPCMPTFLHVFEPRYRLMVRRAMEADRTFGMVLYRPPFSPDAEAFESLGTLLRIVNIEYMDDGRSLLETVGVSRFRVTRTGMQDGYLVGNIQKIDDMSVADEEAMEARETARGRGVQDFSAQRQMADPENNVSSTTAPAPTTRSERLISLENLETKSTQELLQIGVEFVRKMQQQSAPWLMPRILAIYGECPDDPAIFPWWLGSILPVKESEKFRLLATTSVRERLKICCRWIVEWESSRWSVPLSQ